MSRNTPRGRVEVVAVAVLLRVVLVVQLVVSVVLLMVHVVLLMAPVVQLVVPVVLKLVTVATGMVSVVLLMALDVQLMASTLSVEAGRPVAVPAAWPMDRGRASAMDSAGVETVYEFFRTPRVDAGVSPYLGDASPSIYSRAGSW